MGKPDPYFLKQRLAFHIAMGSIIQDFPKDVLMEKLGDGKSQKIYDISSLDKGNNPEDDDFLTSVYKDMFFSEIFYNYNVLTMANMLKLFTEKYTLLGDLEPISTTAKVKVSPQNDINEKQE